MQRTQPLPQPSSLKALQDNGQVSLFLDFDGTLVDIAPRPDAIIVPETLVHDLSELHDQLEGRLALISGRAISNLETFLGTIAIPCAGSHGIDRRLADGNPLNSAPALFPEDVRVQLKEFATRKGFSLEDKPHGCALHYRAKPSLENEGLDFATKVAAKNGLVIKRGKCVIEMVHPGADKGGAVRAFMAHEVFSGSSPIFIGDDVTDEDGFAAVQSYGGTAILIGDREPTIAKFGLSDPAALYKWLGWT